MHKRKIVENDVVDLKQLLVISLFRYFIILGTIQGLNIKGRKVMVEES